MNTSTGRPGELNLARGHVLMIVTGAGSAAWVPGWLAAFRGWYAAEVRVLLSTSAQKLLHPKAVAVASGVEVVLEGEVGEASPRVLHRELSQWADLVLVTPATMNFIAKSSLCVTDSLPVYTALCASGPVVVAAAVPPSVYSLPMAQNHVRSLRSHLGWHVLDPVPGLSLNSGAQETGGMLPFADVLRHASVKLGAL